MKKVLAKLWEVEYREEAYYENILPLVPFKKTIPLSIHQTYYTHKIPHEIAQNIEYLKSENPNCTYKLWNDEEIEEFICKHYGDTIYTQYYKRINPVYGAAKADLFRYLLIYKFGGLYLDIKSSLTRPLSEIIASGHSCYLTHWDNEKGEKHEGYGCLASLSHISHGEYIQWMLCFSPGHPFLRQAIIEVLKRIDTYNPIEKGVGRRGVISTTGPIPFSLAIYQAMTVDNKMEHLYQELRSCSDLGLVYSIYEIEPAHSNEEHKKVFKASYADAIEEVIISHSRRLRYFYYLYSKLLALYIKLVALLMNWGIKKRGHDNQYM